MGAAIRADVQAGKDVRLVLATRGDNVHATRRVNATLARDGLPPISAEKFVDARNTEFVAAADDLGVPADHLTFVALPDGSDATTVAKAVDWAIATFGTDAGYNSMSWLDLNPTHHHLADRLDRSCLAGQVEECHFYQYSAYNPETTGRALTSPVTTPLGTWITDMSGAVVAAGRQYRVWAPTKGRYAIGWGHSVPGHFVWLMGHPRAWEHGPSFRDTWTTRQDRVRALAWIAVKQKDPDPELAAAR